MQKEIENSLKGHFDGKLVDELLAAYKDAKHNFFLGGLRLSAVEGGRFCEAALRILEEITSGSFTPLNKQIDSERLMLRLANAPGNAFSASIRLNIPRAIRVVYDIRNSRDAAHLADGIDPNLQDATLVVSNIDWILAEFIRLYHSVSAKDAQLIIDRLVSRAVPAVQDFNGFLKVLNPSLRASEYVLLLLYERGPGGADISELASWVKPSMRANLKRTLGRLVHHDAYVHEDANTYYLTKLGVRTVESQNLHNLT